MLNLGTLQFFLGVNTRALEAARGRIETFGRSVENAQRAANRGIDTNIAQMRKVENTTLRALASVNKMQEAIGKAKLAPDVRASMLADVGRAYNDLTKGIIRAGQAADNTRLDRNFAAFQNRLSQLNSSLKETERQTKAAAQAANAFAGQESRLAVMAEKAKNLEAAMQRAAVSMPQAMGPALANLAQQVDTAFSRIQGKLAGGRPLDPAAFRRASTEYTQALGNIRREFQRLQSEARAPAIADWQKFQDVMRNMGASFLLLNGHLGGMSTRLFALGTLVGTLGVKIGLLTGAVVGLGMALGGMVKGSLQAQLQIEKVDKALTAVTGSAAIAQNQLKFLREVAQQTGAGFLTLTNSYARYVAASRAAGQSLEETQQQYQAIANASATLSLSTDDTAGVFRAFEQMLSKGSVQAEELRNQLGDRLPGAFNIAAKAMGVTTRQLSDMTKKGEVLSRDFVPKFIEAMKVAYGLDVTKPIDTLQGALNRASDAVFYFYDAFNKNTRVVEAAKAVLSLFTRGLQFLERNMDQIVATLGVATRATAAFAAAWVVWSATAHAGTVMAVVAAIARLIPLLVSAGTWTRAWAAAQAALNALLVATPVGKLIGLVARLGVTIAAAVFSYKQLDKWLGSTNDEFANTSHISAYINQQKALGFQIRSVTNDLMQQAKALALSAAARTRSAVADHRAARTGGPSLGDYAQAANAQYLRLSNPAFSELPSFSPSDFQKGRVADARKEMDAAADQARAYTKLLKDLGEVGKLPDEQSQVPDILGGDEKGGKTKKAAEANINAIEKLILAYGGLQEKMRLMASLSSGPDGFLKVEALYEAKEALRDLSEQELAQASAALAKAGYNTGTLEERLSSMILSSKKAEKAIDAFTKAWDDLDEAGKKIGVLRDQMDALAAGSTNKAVEKFQDFADALEMTKNLNDEGVAALAQKLSTLGVAIDPATIGMEGLTKALAAFFGEMRGAEDAVDYLKDFNDEMKDFALRAQEVALIREGLGKGLTFEEGDLQVWVNHQMILGNYKTLLEQTGLTADEVKKKLAEMNAAMVNEQANEKFLEQAKQMEDFRRDVAQSFAEAAGSIITSFGDIKNAAKNLVNDLVRLFTQKYITKPLFNFIDSMLSSQGLFKFATGGLVKAATGGYIRGGGTTTSDSIPALLSDKEFVFNAKAVQKWGVPMLAAMNSGRTPGFASGGPVNDNYGAANNNMGAGIGSPWGYGGIPKIAVAVSVNKGEMFEASVKAIALEQAVAVTTTGIEEYNERLPDRVQEIGADPRAR